MKDILLTKGKRILLDDEDYEWANKYKWYTKKNRSGYYGNWYIVRYYYSKTKRTTIRMHREIMGLCKEDISQVDHKDHNGFNNQKANLRICTNKENQQNKKPVAGCFSKYKGVSYNKRDKLWQSQITNNGKRYYGWFKNEVDAAIDYDKKAKELFGEFAYLNFQPQVK